MHYRHLERGPSPTEISVWSKRDIQNKDTATLQSAVRNIYSFSSMINDPWSGYVAKEKGEGARNRELVGKLEKQQGEIMAECASRGLVLNAAGDARTNYWEKRG